MSSADEARELALFLHDNFCIWNHTDGCGWYYEIHSQQHDWNQSSHQSYYRQAKKMIKLLEPDVPPGVIVMVLEAYRKSR